MAAARIRIVARLGGGGASLPPYVLWSGLVHGLLVAALVLFPSLRPRRTIPDNAIMVSLVGAPRPAGPVAPPAPPTPPPKETPPPETATLATREPPPAKALPENPKPVKKPKPKEPEKAPPPRPARDQTPPPTDAEPAPGEAGGARPPGAGGVSALASGDAQYDWYRATASAAIEAQWTKPFLEGLLEAVEVRVEFEILRDGTVRDLRVTDSSGIPVVDRSALRAVADASPLPPLPLSVRGPSLPIGLVFRQPPE